MGKEPVLALYPTGQRLFSEYLSHSCGTRADRFGDTTCKKCDSVPRWDKLYFQCQMTIFDTVF